MKAKSFLVSLLLLLGCGRGTDSGTEDLENPLDNKEAAESLPSIDFQILGEARPVDLIEMKLEFPESLKKLDGRRVRMVGFMAPFDSLEDMSRCQMVPSYVGCNFCSPPNLRQVVYVTQGKEDEPDETYSFIEEPSHVTGTFRISLPGSNHEGKDLGFVYSIEEATVTVHTGEAPKRAQGHGTPQGHKAGQGVDSLPQIEFGDLIREVAEIMGRGSPPEISIDRVSAKVLGDFVLKELELNYQKETRTPRAKAFSLLGLLPENVDWLDALEGFELAQRVSVSDASELRVLLLESIPVDHPYARLELVSAIAEVLIRNGKSSAPADKSVTFEQNDDSRRAKEALFLGTRNVVVRRYARTLGISTSVPPPEGFVPLGLWMQGTSLLNRWYTLPDQVGPYFVNFHIGPTGSLSGFESALVHRPSTTIEFFRPLWHQDSNLWKRDPVPKGFTDDLFETPPDHSDVLGAGGLMPFLAGENSGHIVMTVSGQWAGDRWALWQFPDGSCGLFLETRWQDEKSALEFSNAIPSHPFQWFFPHEDGASRVRLLRASSSAALNRLVPSSQ